MDELKRAVMAIAINHRALAIAVNEYLERDEGVTREEFLMLSVNVASVASAIQAALDIIAPDTQQPAEGREE